MTQTTDDRLSPIAPDKLANRPPAAAAEVQHKRGISPFGRHFLELLAAMAAGMIAAGAIFESIVGLKTWDEVTTLYPAQALLAMAAGMSIPMAAWMLFRGMGWKNSYEMTAAMVLRSSHSYASSGSTSPRPRHAGRIACRRSRGYSRSCVTGAARTPCM
jgi:hypothetical protein